MFGKRSSSTGGGNDAARAVPAPGPQAAPPPSLPQGHADNAAGAPAIVEGGRSPIPSAGLGAPLVPAPAPGRRPAGGATASSPPLTPIGTDSRHTDAFYATKTTVFGALIEAIDLAQLAKLDAESSREEIRDIVNEIIAIKSIVLSISEQEELLDDICNNVLGFGPLEPLCARRYRRYHGERIRHHLYRGQGQDSENRNPVPRQPAAAQHLPAHREPDRPSRGRSFADLRRASARRLPRERDCAAACHRRPGAHDSQIQEGQAHARAAGSLRNDYPGRRRNPQGDRPLPGQYLVSGGTGSGKTTLLNCLTRYIDDDERIITCEDAAELQLQQPHTVRLETRPPNLEGEGQITMRDLVRNCLRMRPERIIVGEVRGPEAFDLLQAMNTGHDGSMGTLHANSPREALSRVESMITMGGYSLPSRTIREMLCGSIDVIVQAARLRDGSRRITHITEVVGMEGDVIITQDLFVYDLMGEDEHGNLVGRHHSTGIGRPRFWERARYYGEEKRLAAALDTAEAANPPARA